MFHSYSYDGVVFNLVTITIGVIGIVVPTLFTIFTYYLVRRQSKTEEKSRTEMRAFIDHLRLEHAAETIGKRQNAH